MLWRPLGSTREPGRPSDIRGKRCPWRSARKKMPLLGVKLDRCPWGRVGKGCPWLGGRVGKRLPFTFQRFRNIRLSDLGRRKVCLVGTVSPTGIFRHGPVRFEGQQAASILQRAACCPHGQGGLENDAPGGLSIRIGVQLVAAQSPHLSKVATRSTHDMAGSPVGGSFKMPIGRHRPTLHRNDTKVRGHSRWSLVYWTLNLLMCPRCPAFLPGL